MTKLSFEQCRLSRLQQTRGEVMTDYYYDATLQKPAEGSKFQGSEFLDQGAVIFLLDAKGNRRDEPVVVTVFAWPEENVLRLKANTGTLLLLWHSKTYPGDADLTITKESGGIHHATITGLKEVHT
jgi:hypothetical protein